MFNCVVIKKEAWFPSYKAKCNADVTFQENDTLFNVSVHLSC